MKKSSLTKAAVLFTLVAVLLTLATREAYALWRLFALTPQTISYAPDKFDIQTKELEEKKQFTITITQKTRKGSPALPVPSARLIVSTKDDSMANVPVEGERTGAKTVYRFRVSAQTLAHSNFEVQMPNFPREKGKIEILGGGTMYTLKLQDFVPATTVPAP